MNTTHDVKFVLTTEEDDEYNWYEYDIKEADDIGDVCEVLNNKAGEYTYFYDEEASGTWHERNKKGQIVNDGSSSFDLALAPGIIAVIVAVSLVVVAGAAFLCMRCKKSNTSSDSNEPVYQGGTMM